MKKTYLLMATAIFCWSTVATITKILLGNLNSFQVLCISSFFAFLFLATFNVVTGRIKKMKSYSAKDYIISVAVTIPSTFFYYVFYYLGTDLMPASQAFIVNYLWPIMSVLFACIILKEKLTLRIIGAILISFVGVLISILDSLGTMDSSMLLGGFFCLMGAMSYGIFTALTKKYDYDKWLIMMLGFLSSFVLTFIINAFSHRLFVPAPLEVVGFAWNGIFTMAIASVCWTSALQRGNTAKISNFAYITPFLSLVWTALFLHEKITVYSIAGLIVIVAGILIQATNKKEVK